MVRKILFLLFLKNCRLSLLIIDDYKCPFSEYKLNIDILFKKI